MLDGFEDELAAVNGEMYQVTKLNTSTSDPVIFLATLISFFLCVCVFFEFVVNTLNFIRRYFTSFLYPGNPIRFY